MGSEKSGETLSLRKRRPMEAAEEDEEEREIQELEKEVGEMARRLLDFRGTIPDRLMEAFSSRLVAQRPLFSPQIGATSAPSETLVGADSGAVRSSGHLTRLVASTSIVGTLEHKSPLFFFSQVPQQEQESFLQALHVSVI
uniref:Uncharacterized protein LOC105042900 isoform X2 n=1 Tax=Elaeis guineensis var. tenera TaxID=51953 RepID=A0A8N4EY31_ELAGV|nr:uncharacterized protein LOC105042900 isoform X2 [Elaeis guineensis]